jgi:hypothetical protein
VNYGDIGRSRTLKGVDCGSDCLVQAAGRTIDRRRAACHSTSTTG